MLSKNIQSSTVKTQIKETDKVWWGAHARAAIKALAVIWQVTCESVRGGLTPLSVWRYQKTVEG
jgi:hypothetical protein